MGALQITRGKVHKAQKIVLYGVEGIGKTTFAAQFPDALFIDTEGSTYAYDVARIEPAPGNWTMLMEYVEQAIAEKPCKTLVIDTADWAEILCTEQLCYKNKWASIDAPGYGAGYTALKDEFSRLLTRLTYLSYIGINVVLTAHAATRKFERPDEAQAYDRWELKLQKKTAALVKEWADAILFVNYKTIVEAVDAGMGQTKGKARGNKRVMYVSHDACWDAKNRWGLDGEQEFDYSVIAPFIEEGASQEQAPQEQAQEPTQTAPDFWKPALQLMEKDGVTLDEVREVAAQLGHFAIETPPENFPLEYITSFIVPNWSEILKAVETNRFNKIEVPF